MKTFKQILEQSEPNPYSNSRKIASIPTDPTALRRLTETDHAHSINFFNRLTIPLSYIHRSLRGQANMSLLLGNINKYHNMSERLAIHHPDYTDQHLVDVKTVMNLVRGQIRDHPILIRKISQLPTFADKSETEVGDHIDHLIRRTERLAHDDVRAKLEENPNATIIPPFSKSQSLRDHLLDFIQSHK